MAQVNAMRKNCWVTGASSGLGRAITVRLAAAGHRVYASGRNGAALWALADEESGDIVPVPCDVTDDDTLAGVLAQHDVDCLDLVILCAGTCEYVDLPDLDVAMMRRVMETNYFGVVNACAAALPLMKRAAANGRGRPHLIGIGSMSSYVGLPRAEAYGASKAAMRYFLDSLRTDLHGQADITVVHPGFVETPMTAQNDFPMPLLMTADKAAGIILAQARRRPLAIAFPWRLHLALRAMQVFQRLWYSLIVPRLSRQSGATKS